jgi:hypothetical protein
LNSPPNAPVFEEISLLFRFIPNGDGGLFFASNPAGTQPRENDTASQKWEKETKRRHT